MAPNAARIVRAAGITLALVLVTSAVVPPDASAANTCKVFLQVEYLPVSGFYAPGDLVHVRVVVGTGAIFGAPGVTLNRARFDLDCDASQLLGTGCTDDGSVVAYGGDGTLTTDCPSTTFSSGHPVGSSPNQVVLTASPPLFIPANNPEYCSLEFDVRVQSRSNDVTPDQIEQVVGVSVSDGDAGCSNGLTVGGSQSSALILCPTCDDGNVCTADGCDRDTGECRNVPGTSDADGDGEADATDRCPGTDVGAPVDDAGCAQAQFCAKFDAVTSDGARACRKADWGNDEPTMRPREADCVIDRGGKGRADDRCVPAP